MITVEVVARSMLKIPQDVGGPPANSCQSSFGAPSSSQMIGIGYGSQMSAAMSARPAVGDVVDEPARSTSRMNGRSRSAARGENAGATSRRSRVCTSPSADRMLTLALEELGVGDPHQLGDLAGGAVPALVAEDPATSS